MRLKLIEKIIEYINKLPSCTKTCIIVCLCTIIFVNYIKVQNVDLLKEYSTYTEQKEQTAEYYTFKTASDINRYISDICLRDTMCYNVLLLNYHNTQKSIQGYRYLYLNCLTEKPKGIDSEPLRDYWSNLEYVYYEDELSKIHNEECVAIRNIESIKTTMPKMYRKLKMSGAEAANFYTIEGRENPIGMVIILYDHPIRLLSYKENSYVFSNIQKLAVLLDYKNSKK